MRRVFQLINYAFDRAHVILPYQSSWIVYRKEAIGDNQIGTTIKEIWSLIGQGCLVFEIRIVDLLDKDIFRERLGQRNLAEKIVFEKLY